MNQSSLLPLPDPPATTSVCSTWSTNTKFKSFPPATAVVLRSGSHRQFSSSWKHHSGDQLTHTSSLQGALQCKSQRWIYPCKPCYCLPIPNPHYSYSSSPTPEDHLDLRDATQKACEKRQQSSPSAPSAFGAKSRHGMQVHFSSTLPRVSSCSTTPSCIPAGTTSVSPAAAGNPTDKEKTTTHIPPLKGRSKHRDTLLTRRYMLAHIPLPEINILASVLTFTSSSPSHLNHYNHCIYSSLPPIAPCQARTLPSASTSFLSRNRSQAAFYLCEARSYLHCQWQQPWSLSHLHPSTLSFIHLFSFIFRTVSSWGQGLLPRVHPWHSTRALSPASPFRFCNKQEQGARLELQASTSRSPVLLEPQLPQ